MFSCNNISVVRDMMDKKRFVIVKIQLIDRVNGEQQLREKEGQWAYRLNTLDPNGLNNFFFVQNRRS